MAQRTQFRVSLTVSAVFLTAPGGKDGPRHERSTKGSMDARDSEVAPGRTLA